jgi:uridine kinase
MSALVGDVTPVVVGIAGGTGSGKTTFARAIVDRVGKDNVTFISHDNYYKALNHLTAEERDSRNFDHPDALDTHLLVEHVKELKQNKAVCIPTYDFGTHCRVFDATHELFPQKVIIIEGILILADTELVKLLDIKVFVDMAADVRILRRLKRDMAERNRPMDSVITQYYDTVRPMHDQYVEPSKLKADLIVPGINNNVSVDLVACKIRNICGI